MKKTHNCPILLLVYLSKVNEKQGAKPTASKPSPLMKKVSYHYWH